MKAFPRVVLAVMSLVGPLAMADTSPADLRLADAVASSEMQSAPAETGHSLPVGAEVNELERQVRELESEVARVQSRSEDRFKLPDVVWNVGTDGP